MKILIGVLNRQLVLAVVLRVSHFEPHSRSNPLPVYRATYTIRFGRLAVGMHIIPFGWELCLAVWLV